MATKKTQQAKKTFTVLVQISAFVEIEAGSQADAEAQAEKLANTEMRILAGATKLDWSGAEILDVEEGYAVDQEAR
jgi:hypothetical protein